MTVSGSLLSRLLSNSELKGRGDSLRIPLSDHSFGFCAQSSIELSVSPDWCWL